MLDCPRLPSISSAFASTWLRAGTLYKKHYSKSSQGDPP
jgi:hypothetical protein